jgi:hypothetical protein
VGGSPQSHFLSKPNWREPAADVKKREDDDTKREAERRAEEARRRLDPGADTK